MYTRNKNSVIIVSYPETPKDERNWGEHLCPSGQSLPVCLSGRQFCHLIFPALKSAREEGRHHKISAYPPVVLVLGEHLNPTCNSLVWQTAMWMYGPSVSPHKQVGFPATDIEFPSLITHYRLH